MAKKTTAWLVAGAVLLLFVVAAVALPLLFDATGARGWVLRGGLLFFGAVAGLCALRVR